MKKNTIRHLDDTSPLLGRANPGDRLLSINGKKIIDVLDYKYYAYDAHLHLTLQRPDGSTYELHVEKDNGGDLGVDFESYLMDEARSCANNCIFCFIDQLPPGMRPTMYFKDDDARLSFLLGNYITLTNLSDREIQRIIDLHVSPVNISVHATDPEVRRAMLRNKNAGRCMELMRRFAEGGITMNCQIVCCPGVNDGAVLQQTMQELAELYPRVRSVSVVPLGLTKFRDGLPKLTPFTPDTAGMVLDEVTVFGDQCLKKYGSRIFFCGDEFYLKCGREIPEDAFYEDYVQLENGVGMLRLLETEFSSALALADKPENTLRFSIACGVSVGPYFENLLAMARKKYDTVEGFVYPIQNDFFGHSINVSGLVTGGDLIAQLTGKNLGDRLLISQNMIRREERDFLDDVTLEQAEKALGVPIIPVEQDGFALWDAICGLTDSQTGQPAQRSGNEEYYRYN